MELLRAAPPSGRAQRGRPPPPPLHHQRPCSTAGRVAPTLAAGRQHRAGADLPLPHPGGPGAGSRPRAGLLSDWSAGLARDRWHRSDRHRPRPRHHRGPVLRAAAGAVPPPAVVRPQGHRARGGLRAQLLRAGGRAARGRLGRLRDRQHLEVLPRRRGGAAGFRRASLVGTGAAQARIAARTEVRARRAGAVPRLRPPGRHPSPAGSRAAAAQPEARAVRSHGAGAARPARAERAGDDGSVRHGPHR